VDIWSPRQEDLFFPVLFLPQTSLAFPVVPTLLQLAIFLRTRLYCLPRFSASDTIRARFFIFEIRSPLFPLVADAKRQRGLWPGLSSSLNFPVFLPKLLDCVAGRCPIEKFFIPWAPLCWALVEEPTSFEERVLTRSLVQFGLAA